jgi:chromosome segregation protein
VEEEVRKRLRPLALQATAAERAEKLGREVAGLRARIAQLDLAESGARRAEAEERREAAAFAKRGAQGRLDGLLTDRARAEEELSDAAGRREAAVAARYRLQGGVERLELRGEAAAALLERLRAETPTASDESEAQSGLERLEVEARRAAEAARSAERERVAAVERAELVRERLRTLEQALAEQEGLPPAARALQEDGARLALAALDVPAGDERAVAAALRSRASAVLADDPAVGLALLQRARAAGLGSLTVLAGKAPQELVAELPVVPLDELLDVAVPSVTSEGFGHDPASGELWFAGETAEAVLLELQGRRTVLATEAATLDEEVAAAARLAEDTAERARTAEAALGRAPRARASSIDARTLGRLVELATSLRDCIEAAQRAATRFEAPLRARVDAGSTRAGELGDELRRLGAAEVNLRRELEEAGTSVTAAEVDIARIDAEVADATRRLSSAGEIEPAQGDDREELATRADRLETRRATLGQVNPLAREEYEEEKERLDDLKRQRADLEQSLEELEKLRAELTATVERRFAETFSAVATHFEEVASTLFPGGEGRLRLVESHEDGAEPGVEVELRPAGKRITQLSLLSGGEKALGAISFLFALFLARPCAFYLLDEVEAALDDTNIARFVELLRRYSDRAQFVVVTHQKRTMEAADVLYGVTMGPDGVSQVVSRRLPQQHHAEHAAA